MKLALSLLVSLLLSGCAVFKTPSKRIYGGPTWADDVVGQQIRDDHEKNERNFKKTREMVAEEKKIK